MDGLDYTVGLPSGWPRVGGSGAAAPAPVHSPVSLPGERPHGSVRRALWSHWRAVRALDSVHLLAPGRGVRTLHAAQPLLAVVIGRLRGRGPLLLGAVPDVHLAGVDPVAARLDGAGSGVRAVLHARPRLVRHASPPLLTGWPQRGAIHLRAVSKTTMRRVLVCLVPVCLGACAARPPAVIPDPKPALQLAAADALVRAGCLECLVSAYHAYDVLRSTPSVVEAATAGAIRAAALVALRQHELGMVDEGYLALARGLTSGQTSLPAFLPQLLDVIDALPSASIGAGHPTSAADLTKMDTLRTNRAAWTAMLRGAAGIDEAAAYTWLSFMCGATEARAMTRDELFAPVSTFGDTALILYRQATCRGVVEPQ